MAQLCGCMAANVSGHLALLMKRGSVGREGRGNSVYYRIADASIYSLCDLVCRNIARQLERNAERQQVFAQSAPQELVSQ